MKVPVSVLIPIKNEASNLRRNLQSVSWADEIFVVDSQSTDGSQQVVEEERARRNRQARKAGHSLRSTRSASEEGLKFVQFHFNGTWPKKKNWALDHLPFKHEWVFILDADEVMPPEAEIEFRRVITNSANSIDGYWINRRFMFMGKWLKHAYYPNWNLRLFKHRLGRYEKLTDVDTASGDNEVHEHVVVQGQTGRLVSEMDHYAFPSVNAFVEKHNRYSNWEARVALDRFLKGSSQSLQSKEVGFRRRLKLLSQKLPGRPTLRFLFVYLWQQGFRDGKAGYHFARLHAVYEYLCVVKTEELKESASSLTRRVEPQSELNFSH